MSDSFETFKARWHKKSEEFKKYGLDGYTCLTIYKGFLNEFLIVTSNLNKKSIVNFYLEREQLANDVTQALQVAFHNHKEYLRESSWWYRLFSGDKKLDLSIFKLP